MNNNLLTELLTSSLGVNPDTLEFTPQKSPQLNQVYHIVSNQSEFSLHIAPADDTGLLFYEKGMMRQLPALHTLIRAETTIPVPEVAAFGFDSRLIDRDFVILTAMSGRPFGEIDSFNHAQHNRVLWQMGDFLRQLHAVTGSVYGYDGPHQPMTPQPTWRRAFEIMWHSLIADLAAGDIYSDAEISKLQQAWAGYSAYFEQDAPPSLLRMEEWDSHILVDEAGEVTGLSGFERALWGDPEAEFAVLDYCGIYASAVWKGYGLPRPATPESQIRRKFYLLYEIQRHIPGNVWRDKDLEEAMQSKQMAMIIVDNLLASINN